MFSERKMCRVKNGSNVKRSVCFFCVGTTFSYKETRVPESSDNLNRELTGSETLSLDVGGGRNVYCFRLDPRVENNTKFILARRLKK